MAGCIRRVVDALPGRRIEAVAAASMGEAGAPLDALGEPIYPIMAWFDQRSEAQAARLRRDFGEEALHSITGQHARPVFGLCKILWLRDNHPEVLQRLAHWLSMEDYMLWKLSGVAATDYSMASRTMLFDQTLTDWSPTLLDYCGLHRDVLPAAFSSGTIIGAVSEQAARETGLPAGTPVATGGHDHLCGAIAAGAVETGRFLDSSGTAQSMVMPVEEFHGGGDVCAHGFTCYRHVLRGRFVVQGGLNTAGGSLEWVVKLAGNCDYADLYHEAAESGPGRTASFVCPTSVAARRPMSIHRHAASSSGLTLEHGRGDLMRAVIEGLAYYLRLNLEHMALVGPVADGHILAIGGANREPLVLQTKADVCNRTVLAATVPEATAVGAALMAGIAAGVFGDERQAAASVASDFRRYEPDPERAATYDRLFREQYTPLYPALRNVRHGV